MHQGDTPGGTVQCVLAAISQTHCLGQEGAAPSRAQARRHALACHNGSARVTPTDRGGTAGILANQHEAWLRVGCCLCGGTG
eukprot:490524-Rhodomonas_salina.3